MQGRKKKKRWASVRDRINDNLPVVVTIAVFAILGACISVFHYQPVYDFADAFGTATGLISVIIGVITWYSIRHMRNAYKPVASKQLIIGDDTAIMCIGCKGQSISRDVAQYIYKAAASEEIEEYQKDILTNDKSLGEYNPSKETGNQYNAVFQTEIEGCQFGYGRFIDVTISDTMPIDKAKQYTAYFAMNMEETFSRLKAMGISKFKVFYSGPVLLPAALGYIAKNNVALELYHYDSSQTLKYTSMGAMQLSWREAVDGKPIDEETISETMKDKT